MLAELVLVGIPGAWVLGRAGQAWANQAWDRSAASIHELTVWDKRETRSRSRRSCYLDLSGWPDGPADHSLQIQRTLFDAVRPAACLQARVQAARAIDMRPNDARTLADRAATRV